MYAFILYQMNYKYKFVMIILYEKLINKKSETFLIFSLLVL